MFDAVAINSCHVDIAPLLGVLIHRVELFQVNNYFIYKIYNGITAHFILF